MVLKKYIILSLVTLFLLTGCGKKSNTRKDSVTTTEEIVCITPAPEKIEFKFEDIHPFNNMRDVVLLGTKDSIIYLFRYIEGTRYLSLYDYVNDRVIRNIRLFKDPKKTSDMQYVNYVSFHKDSLGYYDRNERIYHCFSYKDLINGILKYSSSPRMPAGTYAPYKYLDMYIVVRSATDDDEKSSHMVYRPLNHKKILYDFYPDADLSKNDPYLRRPYQVFGGYPLMNENLGILVQGSRISNVLTIIEVDDDCKLSLKKQLNNLNPNTLTYDGNAFKGQLMTSYAGSQATENYFYLSYKGKEFLEEGKSHILQYDWDGSLVKIISINGDCCSFAVTPDNSMVYVIYSDSEGGVRRLIKGGIS